MPDETDGIAGLAERICVLEEQRTALAIAVIALMKALSPDARARVTTELQALQKDMQAKEEPNGANLLRTLLTVTTDARPEQEAPIQ